MKWQSHLIIGLATIFIATFMLIYVLQSIENIIEKCKADSSSEICEKLNPFNFPVIIIVLIIAGFIIIICTTAYILLSPKGLVW